MQSELPGIAFEKVVAQIQSQIDPTSTVTHNEKIIDRLGHERQFDIVIRGKFAGQDMLGIIECKDLKRRVGNPEIDAFVTKASDVNANFKIMMSRSGFSAPALDKCAHYGIQALSLLENDPANQRFFIGTRWTADLTRWGQLSVSLHFVDEPTAPVIFTVDNLLIDKKRVLDWFTNYLNDHAPDASQFGWIVDLAVVFDTPQILEIDTGEKHLCSAISFKAERVCVKLERLVGISGTGFFNWHSNQLTFPPGATITTAAVPTDFTQWTPRSDAPRQPSGFIDFHIVASQAEFERVDDAPNLDAL